MNCKFSFPLSLACNRGASEPCHILTCFLLPSSSDLCFRAIQESGFMKRIGDGPDANHWIVHWPGNNSNQVNRLLLA
jgi:hypothetical protein